MLYYTSNMVNCPVCNTPARFASGSTNLKVCAVCNTAMERLEGDGLSRILPIPVAKKDERSIIQIGTRGKYNDKNFEVIGCLHCELNSYHSNRWTILFADGKTGLLTDSLGFYAMQERMGIDYPTKAMLTKNIVVGTEKTELVKGQNWYVFDTDKCHKIYLEGEAILMDDDGVFTATELGNTESKRFELLELKKDMFELYSISQVTLDALVLSNIHHPVSTPITLACDKCRWNISIKAPQYSMHCVCPNCQGWNEIIGKNKLKFRNKNFSPIKPDLPIGSKGIIKGIEYEVVGAINKNESGSIETYWREYTLLSAKQGFAYLSEYNGHWTYLKEVKLGSPWPAYKNELEVDGEVFDLFNNYSYKIKAAIGEFITPLNNQDVLIREYIAPPNMYAAEFTTGKELTWFKGEFIDNNEIFEGLGLVDKSMPVIAGIGPLQTQKFHANMRFLSRISIAAVLLFFSVQVLFEFNSRRQLVYENNFSLPDSVLSKGINTSSFELKPTSSNLQFIISSPVSNTWFEAAVTVVNDKTGTEYTFEKGVEYYYGYSDGENWSEGEKEDEITLSSIPAGKYHLNIFPSFGTHADIQEFKISIINDIPMWRNFFIIILILITYPVIMWWRSQSFEKKRWNNSAYNPYNKEEND